MNLLDQMMLIQKKNFHLRWINKSGHLSFQIFSCNNAENYVSSFYSILMKYRKVCGFYVTKCEKSIKAYKCTECGIILI